MRTFEQQLTRYAAYHRDPRNIATHFVGVPMILFAVVILLSRPVMAGAGSALPITPALLAVIAAAAYYLILHRATGLLMSAILIGLLTLAHAIAVASTAVWLSWGLGLFIVGWVIQAVGHVYEGRKPAFFDDVMGLIIGPLFVLCEALFGLGLLRQLDARINSEVGPVVRQDRANATS